MSEKEQVTETAVEKNLTEPAVVDPMQLCAREIDEVLKKHNMTLMPTLQLIPATKVAEEEEIEA